MSGNFPLTNINKKIYDPFDGLPETSIGVRVKEERREYEVHRACGHCRGTGKRRDDKTEGLAKTPKCPQCLLGKHYRGREATSKGVVEVWGQTISVFAFELTEAELNHLDPNKKMGAMYEIGQHSQQRLKARVESDEEYQAGKAVVVSRIRSFA